MQGRKKGLTPAELRYVQAAIEPVTPTAAAARAGMTQPARDGWRMANRPQVQAAIRAEQERRLNEEALPLAIDWLVRCIGDETFKPADRNTAARIVVQNTLGKGEHARDKAPEDMTPDELAARITILRARQAQLADGAKVIEGEAETVDAAAPQGDVFG